MLDCEEFSNNLEQGTRNSNAISLYHIDNRVRIWVKRFSMLFIRLLNLKKPHSARIHLARAGRMQYSA